MSGLVFNTSEIEINFGLPFIRVCVCVCVCILSCLIKLYFPFHLNGLHMIL